MYDVIVIGGGVIGGAVLRELSRYQLKACMLEKQDDVCMGQSKANSGIVHAGFDAVPNTLKAKFNVLGNVMMPDYTAELGVKYKNNRSLVLAFSEEELKTLETLLERGKENGVKGLSILDKQQLKQIEPNVSDDCLGALLASTGGIVCPYELTIAQIGNAMDNGAELLTEFDVVSAIKTQDGFTVKAVDGREVSAKVVINCAGLGGEKVSKIFGDDSVKVNGRKGEYILLDKKCKGFVSQTLFCTPTKKGKGILVSPTVDGNILLGPTSVEIEDGLTITTQEGLSEIKTIADKMCVNIPHREQITSFAGVRAYSDRHDFVIEESSIVKNFINCIGIESPGLTSAPAIGKYVVEEIVGKMLNLNKKANFNGSREHSEQFKNLSIEQKNQVIKNNPSYGKIVCRCEQITEGEIIKAITQNPPARTIDAVKRRTRAGMGRCQGGFCQTSVAELIAKHSNIKFEQVKKGGSNSTLVWGKTK
ncbi:MAG: NAD(P)/FAD-dependent oxidoreductase [Clostridia bacterium]|nr:NAD(P)/FAD-dependent oxidoreductase [Clostridia bacterium]